MNNKNNSRNTHLNYKLNYIKKRVDYKNNYFKRIFNLSYRKKLMQKRKKCFV